ncbi:MAG: O-antigen ligase family protein [Pseudoxanthomonas sp.]
MSAAEASLSTRVAALPVTGWRWASAFVLAFVALWPVPGYAEGVLALGALVAIVRLLVVRVRGHARLLSGPAWALSSALFAAYWAPELFSAPGAVDMGRALRESLVDLRYLPFLWLVAAAVTTPRGRRVTFGGLALIVAAWTLDAVIQAGFGTSPLFWSLDQLKWQVSGQGMCAASDVAAADRLSGVLGPCNAKLGLVMASMSPFLLIAAARRFGIAGWLLATAAVGLVVLLGGARAGWITFALVALCTGWQLLGFKRLALVAVVGVLAAAATAMVSPPLQQRLVRTTAAMSGDEAGMDSALSGRARIWQAAGCMVAGSPVNGVGVRGFREAFAGCDPLPQRAPEWGEGPALHAHQLVLEILSETGFLGLLLWIAGAALAIRAWRYAEPGAREQARPAMLALAVTVFPLNTHLAFYSTFWGGLALLLTALYVGSLLGVQDGEG